MGPQGGCSSALLGAFLGSPHGAFDGVWPRLAVTRTGTALALASGLTLALPAQAAQPGGFGGGAPPPAPGGENKEKKEGPAEEAPEDKEALRPIEPVPAQPTRRRRVQLFELDGYMRIRADYFHRLDLGLATTSATDERPLKFFAPPAETPESSLTEGASEEDREFGRPNDASCFNRLTESGVSASRADNRCRRRDGFASANMRLRLEPTLHISDSVKVHTQIDIFDNIVLGSSPDSYAADNPWAPINLFSRTQISPHRGQNSARDSVIAKRAWGHIHFGFGLDVQFGRMPWSWGMGLVANGGNGYSRGEQGDIVRQLDSDYGDSVDSVRLAFDFGKDRRRTHTVAVSWDWAASGPTTAQLLGDEYASGGTIGQEFSIEKFDNLYQWSLSLERRDDPDMLRRKVSLGTPVFNYGFMAWFRYQDVDAAYGATYDNLYEYANVLVHRRAFIVSPDLWFRLSWRTLRIELEAAGNFGVFRVRDVDDVPTPGGEEDYFNSLTSEDLSRKTVANFGYALEFKYGFFDDRFHIGLDQGFAMGDTAFPMDGNALSPLNENDNSAINNFRFNPAYTVDLLLFRELLGTISNAAYFKPWAAFYFFNQFSARADVNYAIAARPQSTLGNKYSYGVEIDGALRYHDTREPIFFQVQYGVLFPLGAFDRVRTDEPTEDARAVQSVQAQLGIRF